MAKKPGRLTAAEKEQPQLPNMEDEKNPKVHRFGLAALDAKEIANEAKRKAKEAYDALLIVMQAEKVKTYRHGTIDATVDLKPKIKIKRVAAEKKTRQKKQAADESTQDEKTTLKIASA